MTQRSYIMAPDSLEGLGPMAIQSLVAAYPHETSLLRASNQAVAQLLGQRANRWCGPGRFKQCLKEAEDLLDKQSQQGIQSHCFLDDNYPERLKTLPDLPMMIHVIGSASLNVKHMLAALGELLWSNHVMVRHGRYRLQATEASVQGAEAERTP